jgi:hypothetical protein
MFASRLLALTHLISRLLWRPLPALALPDEYRLTVIASNRGPLAYSFYKWAAVNQQGQVCYTGSTGNLVAILLGDFGTQKLIARTGSLPAEFKKFFSQICSINDSGIVAFDAQRNCDESAGQVCESGIYLGAGTTPASLLQKAGEAGGPAVSAVLPTINNHGGVAFFGSGPGLLQGIWTKQGSTLTRRFDNTGALHSLGAPMINNFGRITFNATEDPEAGGRRGIFGPTGQAIAGDFSGLAQWSFSVINDLDQVAYLAVKTAAPGQAPTSGVFINDAAAALNGADFEAIATDFGFQALSLNSKGEIVFPARLNGGAEAVFLRSPSGQLTKLLEGGETLPGLASPLESARVGRQAINNHGQVALVLSLDDGTQLVARLDPPGIAPTPIDNCPDDPSKLEPGVCGCGAPDIDSDADLTPDCKDECPANPAKTSPGVCGCSAADLRRQPKRHHGLPCHGRSKRSDA